MIRYQSLGLYSPLNESIGTIQVGHPQIRSFLNKVYNDVATGKHLSHLLVNEPADVKSMYHEVHWNFWRTNKIYILHYDETLIPWIDSFDILVFESIPESEQRESISIIDTVVKQNMLFEPNFCALALTSYPEITKFKMDSLSHGAIVLKNVNKYATLPMTNVDYIDNKLIEDMFHEMNHYYMDFNIFYHTTHSFMDDDFWEEHYAEYKYFQENMDNNYNMGALWNAKYYEKIKSLVSEGTFREKASVIDKIFTSSCYLLNDIEINAYHENIFSGLCRYYKKTKTLPRSYSDKTLLDEIKILHSYMNLLKLLEYIKNSVDADTTKWFTVRYGSNYFKALRGDFSGNSDEIENISGKSMSINKCIKYFCEKCNSIKKNIGKMIAYLPYLEELQ